MAQPNISMFVVLAQAEYDKLEDATFEWNYSAIARGVLDITFGNFTTDL
ncbi:MAG: hypothetical protein IPK16_05095 [Anaerolineales bacterium]|nr:hypothetical protein [Anaerolineales bacterium]